MAVKVGNVTLNTASVTEAISWVHSAAALPLEQWDD